MGAKRWKRKTRDDSPQCVQYATADGNATQQSRHDNATAGSGGRVGTQISCDHSATAAQHSEPTIQETPCKKLLATDGIEHKRIQCSIPYTHLHLPSLSPLRRCRWWCICHYASLHTRQINSLCRICFDTRSQANCQFANSSTSPPYDAGEPLLAAHSSQRQLTLHIASRNEVRTFSYSSMQACILPRIPAQS